MKILSKSLADTEKAAQDFAGRALSGGGERALIVGLFGDLGAGKTTFTQAFAKALGVEDTVNSPTFVIEKIYELGAGLINNKPTPFQHLIHIDAYRLNGGKELLHLGFEEIANDSKNIIFIEWPEKVADILPSDMIKLYFKFIDEETREITI
jgi:tRNA threonylcarbamoyladenosine biosynthesis protein TsaE